MIVMADIGVLPDAAFDQLNEWVENGGTLVRFAGPRLAATASDDPLLPGRAAARRTHARRLAVMDGAAAGRRLPRTAPSAGSTAPREVTVNRQVLAEPDLDLASKTWANLADGTPLVTGTARGKGSIVLFHVTAEATWSNLPISGSFVEMLRRIANLSRNTGAIQPGNSTVAGEALPPYRILAADGELTAPPPMSARSTRALRIPGATHPAGLYGTADGFVARNVLGARRHAEPLGARISTPRAPPSATTSARKAICAARSS
jgi:hypothetical protein